MLAAPDALQLEVVEVEGGVGRQPCRAADGQWADVERWTGVEAAQRAAHALAALACVQELLRLETPGSGRVLHLRPRRDYPGAAAPGGRRSCRPQRYPRAELIASVTAT